MNRHGAEGRALLRGFDDRRARAVLPRQETTAPLDVFHLQWRLLVVVVLSLTDKTGRHRSTRTAEWCHTAIVVVVVLSLLCRLVQCIACLFENGAAKLNCGSQRVAFLFAFTAAATAATARVIIAAVLQFSFARRRLLQEEQKKG